jgi:hypothetical protein
MAVKGHEFRLKLAPEERRALIAFLKTLSKSTREQKRRASPLDPSNAAHVVKVPVPADH